MIWYAYILLDAIVNWWLIEKRNSVPHYGKLFVIRGMAAIAYGAFILDVQYDFNETFNWLCDVLLPFPFLFNSLLNTFRGKAADHLGANSGWIDSFIVNKFPGTVAERIYYWVTLALFLIHFKFFV
jgi:hypothetical protein